MKNQLGEEDACNVWVGVYRASDSMILYETFISIDGIASYYPWDDWMPINLSGNGLKMESGESYWLVAGANISAGGKVIFYSQSHGVVEGDRRTRIERNMSTGGFWPSNDSLPDQFIPQVIDDTLDLSAYLVYGGFYPGRYISGGVLYSRGMGSGGDTMQTDSGEFMDAPGPYGSGITGE